MNTHTGSHGATLVLVLALSAGCAENPPAPILERAPAPYPESSRAVSEPTVEPVQTPEAEQSQQIRPLVPETRMSPKANAATAALLKAADSDINAGRYANAAAKIDRALQIDPEDASVWHRLARIRLLEGDRDQAMTMALRSNALAADTPQLVAANWSIIAEVRHLDGDDAGSKAALDQVARYSRLATD